MINRGRRSEAALRAEERRQASQEAPRLCAEAPDLQSLSIHIQERRNDTELSESSHIRRYVVPQAPALFLMPCGDPRCRDGGHDITREVISALRSRATEREGEDACRGSIGGAECLRVLHYRVMAKYR